MMDPIRHSLLAVVLILLVGCETDVHPFLENPRPYTVWGVMNAASDTQFVRIFSIEDSPGVDRSGELDAAVSSTDLSTGERRTWNHRRIVFESGNVGHVYWSAFTPEHGHSYRLDVERSDGALSTATVDVPPGIEVDLNTRSGSARIPITIRGDAPHVFAAEMYYDVTNVPPVNTWPNTKVIHPTVAFPVAVPYDLEDRRVGNEWQFTVDMRADAEQVRDAFENNCLVTGGNPDIALRGVEFRVIAADTDWLPPGGVFDPELLVEPGAFSNVENGYGFVGAGEAIRIRWTPTASLREELGYRERAGCNMTPSEDNPACTQPPIPCIGENAQSIWELYFR